MEALRIVLKQNSANYKKEETSLNKMTYPLPPFSTVIGAIHNACGYKEYKPMDISIQGNYESLTLEPYTDYCFLNSVMDDRGILVRFKNSNSLSRAYEKVAKVLKSTGNSFEKGITIQVYNEEILNEYRDLKNLSKKISGDLKKERDEKLKIIKEEKKILVDKKKELKGDKLALEELKKEEIELKLKEKSIKDEFEKFKEENFTKPYSRFASLTTSLKYYETLNNVNLVLHIKSDKETLLDIEKNIYNLKSIGRSEDFVEVIEAKIVNLLETVEDQDEIINQNSAYIDFDLVKEEVISPTRYSDSKNCSGTKYYLNKDYNIVKNKRIFNKKKVLFISGYAVDEEAENIYFDIDDKNKYIVNFI
ncbi:MAG: CRISPR-associated protein Cas5 [Clostridium sp.]